MGTHFYNEKHMTIELSIVMPCLNEAETVAACIQKAGSFLKKSSIQGEIILADNGSTDGSQEIARALGARVIHIAEKGYGNALMGGIDAAQGLYIIMGDADESYDFSALDEFVYKLREGYDLVMGNRFEGGIKPGAMPIHHRYIGNPVLSTIGRIFFGSNVRDFHCGLRGFRKEAYIKMNLHTTGMEFASEMVIKATLQGMKISEIPTILYPDGRSRPPHLRSFRDGWRHLRFMLLYSPRWLFLYPGTFLMLTGLALLVWILPEPRHILGVRLDVHTMLYAFAAIVLGFQSIIFALFTKTFAITEQLFPQDEKMDIVENLFSLENGLILGGALTLSGFIGSLVAFSRWQQTYFGDLNPSQVMRIAIPSILMVVVGMQTIFSSFFLSILRLKRK
jgi:glycosyltransferase involved in cell wall biosynthesis